LRFCQNNPHFQQSLLRLSEDGYYDFIVVAHVIGGGLVVVMVVVAGSLAA